MLSRLFHKELGMGFGDWKMRLKLMEAVKQLGEKKSVKEISFELGHENVSSFIIIATFKKIFWKNTAKSPSEIGAKTQQLGFKNSGKLPT